MRGWLALVSFIGLVCAPAWSDPSLECSLDNGSQVEIGNCVAQAADRADRAMEMALSFARNAAQELDGITGRIEGVPALEAAQDAWAAYRDAHCGHVGTGFGGGSGTDIAIQSCRVELTRQRIRDLMATTR